MSLNKKWGFSSQIFLKKVWKKIELKKITENKFKKIIWFFFSVLFPEKSGFFCVVTFQRKNDAVWSSAYTSNYVIWHFNWKEIFFCAKSSNSIEKPCNCFWSGIGKIILLIIKKVALILPLATIVWTGWNFCSNRNYQRLGILNCFSLTAADKYVRNTFGIVMNCNFVNWRSLTSMVIYIVNIEKIYFYICLIFVHL